VQVGNGATALHAAVENGREGVVRVLLEVTQCVAHGLRNMMYGTGRLFVCVFDPATFVRRAGARAAVQQHGRRDAAHHRRAV
jgi:hypothetical protein